MLGPSVAPDQIFFKGSGCSKCLNSGYLGRTGIFEIVSIDDDFKNAILRDPSLPNLKEPLLTKKVKSLGESALEKVLAGITSIDEALRVVGEFRV